ncbi:MAG: DUF881 domain-containing protein [Actinomycetota bacterium]
MTARRTSLARFGPYVAVGLLGFAIVAAATLPHPGPRVSRRARLIDLIAQEDARSHALRKELEGLQAQLDALRKQAGKRELGLADIQAKIDRLDPFAGMTALTGQGLQVQLRDSPLRSSPTGDPNDLVIHQQDIQAVVNALWAGGAEAISINGERLTSDSAVRCVGNTLLLHGSVYAPPYTIAAIGDPKILGASLASDTLVKRFKIFVDDFHLGFDVVQRAAIDMPAFHGLLGRAPAA